LKIPVSEFTAKALERTWWKSLQATPTRICLVRHGETEWNAARRIQGQIDIGLNETGLRRPKQPAAG
jgi:hypothetical protein